MLLGKVFFQILGILATSTKLCNWTNAWSQDFTWVSQRIWIWYPHSRKVSKWLCQNHDNSKLLSFTIDGILGIVSLNFCHKTEDLIHFMGFGKVERTIMKRRFQDVLVQAHQYIMISFSMKMWYLKMKVSIIQQ